MKGLSTLYNKLTSKSTPVNQEEVTSTPEHTSYWESYKHIMMPAVTVCAAMTTAAMYYFSRQQDGGNEQETLVPGVIPTGNYTSYGSSTLSTLLPTQELLSGAISAAGVFLSGLANMQFGPIGADAAMSIPRYQVGSGNELSAIPVGNCTFYEEYLKANPEVAAWLSGVICDQWLTLNLTNRNIGDTGAIAISPALQQITRVNQLSLDNNNISDAGAEALAHALAPALGLSGVSSLDLSNNNIGPQGAEALALAIVNTGFNRAQLSALYLNNNNIGDNGTQALGGALVGTIGVAEVELIHNGIGFAECADFTHEIHAVWPTATVLCW